MRKSKRMPYEFRQKGQKIIFFTYFLLAFGCDFRPFRLHQCVILHTQTEKREKHTLIHALPWCYFFRFQQVITILLFCFCLHKQTMEILLLHSKWTWAEKCERTVQRMVASERQLICIIRFVLPSHILQPKWQSPWNCCLNLRYAFWQINSLQLR